jgi:uncharacterized membrane protein
MATAPEEPTTEAHEGDGEHHDRFKETTEKIWGSTRSAWNTATFKANQYKLVVQKKIDLAALHKKVASAHADLGKMVDDLREDGKKNILNLTEVRDIFKQIDSLKASAASLEQEIEDLRTAETPHDVTEGETPH